MSILNDFFFWIGVATFIVIIWRALLSFYRRVLLSAKKPQQYGKWAVITGSTSGIGKAFTEYLAEKGMAVLIISRSESKLIEQKKALSEFYGVDVRHITFDFTLSDEKRTQYYRKLETSLAALHADGGIGLLINNVGIANEHPKAFDEFDESELDSMIHCNVFSTINMTAAVLKYMKERKSGCVISISSGSGNMPSSFLALYSATKAFATQFTRSMHVECWGTGVDFYAATPFYVVSNLCKKKKKSGSWLSPIEPKLLVEGVMAQLGKKYIWQGHGYWLHGLQQFLMLYNWRSTDNQRARMIDNRRRYAEKNGKEN